MVATTLNATDPDGPNLTYAFSEEQGGTFTRNANGEVVFAPAANFSGTATATYIVTDGAGGSDTGVISVTVTPVNVNADPIVPPTNSVVTDEDEVSGTVTIGASDPDGDTLTYSLGVGPELGSVTLSQSGTFTYAPALNANGTDSFTILISDGQGGTAEQVVSVTIDPVNDLPTGAVTLPGEVSEGQVLTAGTSTLADADDLGTLNYQWQRLEGDFWNNVGTDQATYTLGAADVDRSIRVVVSYTDGDNTAESVTSNATGPVGNVNADPIVPPTNSVVTDEDEVSGTVTIGASDPDGDTLTYSLGVGPELGSVTLSQSGTFTYAPALNANGTDSFTILISDGQGGTAEQVVSVTIDPVNDLPTGAVTLPGEVSEGQVLTAGTSTLADADDLGTLNYQWQRLEGDFWNNVGTDQATYTLGAADVDRSIRVVVSYTDGDNTAESVTSNATGPVGNVNADPIVPPTNSVVTDEDEVSGTVTIGASDPDGDTLTYSLGVGPELGSVTLSQSGTFTYAPALNANGTDSFTILISDGQGGTAEQVVSVTIDPVNDLPTGAVTLPGEVSEGQVLTAGTSTLADADDLGTLNYQWQRLEGDFWNNVGTDQATYTLGAADVDRSIRVVVSYTDGDNTAESVTSNATGPVGNVNADPIVPPTNSVVTDEDEVSGTVTIGASDPDGDTLTYSLGVGPELGSVTLSQSGTFTYAPALNANGTDSFTILISDGQGGTAEQVVSVTIDPVNDLPTGAVTLPGEVSEGQVLTAGTSTLADADDLGTLNYQWQRLEGDFWNNVGTDQATYTLGAADVDRSIRVVVSYTDGDNTAESVTSNATGPVGNVNAPGAVAITGTATEDQILTAAVSDADGLEGVFIDYRWFWNGAEIDGATGATYTLGDADVGQTITVEASYFDNGGTTETVTSAATQTIVNVNDAPSGASNTITILEDAPRAFAAADFGFTDGDANVEQSLAAVMITTTPAAGTLRLGNAIVTAGQSIEAAQLPNLVFTPAPNANGLDYASFTFQVVDNGGRANGGQDTGPDAEHHIPINVTPVNNAADRHGLRAFAVADRGGRAGAPRPGDLGRHADAK